MSLNRYGNKRDDNEGDIIKALEAISETKPTQICEETR